MKILIIDDDYETGKSLENYFKLKAASCTIVDGGRKALELIEREEFDRIILDMSMPEFSGIDFLNELNKTGKTNHAKIFVFSAISFSKGEKDSIIEKGASMILPKTTTFKQVYDAITC